MDNQIEQGQVELKFAKNQRLPQLDAEVRYGYVGISGDGNPDLTFGTAPPDSSYSDSTSDFFTSDGADNLLIAATFSIPFPNTTARKRVVRSELELRRAKTKRLQLEQTIISSYGLVTAKRVLYVANVGEDDLAGESEPVELVRSHAASSGGEAVAVSGKLEAELAELDEADRLEMLEALGLTEPAIGPVARGVCRLLGLAVFYTTSPKEIRAWTVSAQATAPQAAGVVHSDMQRGFIRAECYSVDDLVQHESERAIRAAGRLRTEGKNSRIRDGDVMRFLFSV